MSAKALRTTVSCLLILTILSCFCCCSIYSQRQTPDSQYLDTRKEIMTSPRPANTDEFKVYAALIDIDAGDHVKTVACFADGTTALYLSTGEAYEDLSAANPSLVVTAQDFFEGISRHLKLAPWQEKTSLSLPDTGKDQLYLLTDQGIHLLTIIPPKVSDSSEDIQTIYGLYMALYLQVMKQVEPSVSAAA